MAILLAADNKAVSEAELKSKVDALTSQISIDTNFAAAAQAAKDGAGKTLAHAQARINELTAQIQVAAAKKPDTSISIGTIVSTVALVGGAVASVIAAIPTGGGSLIRAGADIGRTHH